ncbi:hypothetical protein TRP8649_01151 [Pelagimonas phthalicica]|uniref:Uncharacterized protein n=1 Tax=Pelagimonas phthalicica TaxID=1037362 RepID=A0A238J8Y6_9RHOB|nr:hypothetical protein [Pelagimonas phthalicica]TDS94424.1 hypothetical protein CLV87_0922 [Pelagimonas phthalicica]SMX27049.1 hypothetical protein TRP8649_01151 [Pelagimonas phthalicica]
MFRLLAPIAFFGLLIVGGYYAISSTSIETRLEKKLAILIPEEVQGSVQLEGCMLQVSFPASVKSKDLDYFLNANLVDFDLGSVSLIPGSDGTTRYLAQPTFLSKETRDQAFAISELAREFTPPSQHTTTLFPNSGGQVTWAPLDQDPDIAQRRLAFDTMLKQPGGKLQIHIMAKAERDAATNTSKLVAHKDAPVFYDFVQAVKAMPNHRSLVTTLSFSEPPYDRNSFVMGSMHSPAPIDLRFPDTEEAKEFARLMLLYRQKHCR